MIDEGPDDVVVEHPTPEIAIVRLNRPEVLNALNDHMIAGIYAALAQVGNDPLIRVVILTGAGRAFCAGMDMGAPERVERRSSTVLTMAGQERFAGMTKAIRELRQPVIAAVNGAAAGAGMGLALAADIRVSSSDAKFLVAAIRIGLSAGECGISYHLPRIIGAGRAWEIMLTGRPVEGDEAERIGLVSRAVPRDELEGVALDIAAQIVANSPFGVAQTKRVMRRNIDASSYDEAIELENRTQVTMVTTQDFAEATSAFLEKREPVFRGR
jgi:enoyl-CoA hydratase